MLEKFTLESLSLIDGERIKVAWEAALKRMRLDCEDRPRLDKARKVSLVVTLAPMSRQDGTLSSIDVQVEIDESMPKRQSPTYNMLPERGGLFFNEVSPDEARQGTLDSVGQPKAVQS